MKKDIIAIVEEGTNYFFHVQAVAKINYDNEYSDKYKESINKDDLEFLRKNRNLFEFEGGQPFPLLTALYIFLPASINLNNQEKINDYFETIYQSIKEKKGSYIVEKYSEPLKKVEALHKGYLNTVDLNIKQINSLCFDEAIKISEIIKKNYAKFTMDVWPHERKKLEEVAEKLNQSLKDKNIINRCEEIVGKEYKSPSFKVTLCSSMKNGPDANDLGYDKNCHYYGRSIDEITHFVSHEVIIRILMPIANKYKEEFNIENSYLFYDALESLAEFYNLRVLNEHYVNFFGRLKLVDLYEKLYSESGNLSPEELLKSGLKYSNLI